MKRALRDPLFVVIALLGLVLTLMSVALVQRDRNRASAQWLDERAELIARATEETVENTLADLRAVAAFMATTEPVTQAKFDAFVHQMDMNPGVIGMGYIGVVADTEIDVYVQTARQDVPGFEILSFDGLGGIAPNREPRSVYYPLRFVHGGPFLDIVIAETPIDSQVDALGFDLGTEPLWFPAFAEVLDSAEPSVSDLVGVGGLFEEQAFAAAHPILGSDGRIEGVIVAPGLEILLTADLGVAITSNVEWEVENAGVETGDPAWPVWRRTLDVPGTAWTLSVQPTEDALAELDSPSVLMVIVVGLALSIAVATAAHQIRLRRQARNQVAQLHRSAEDKDRFLATVSHELRTPLTVVIGLASELTDNEFDSVERAELLTMIEEHGQEAGAIVEDLLVAARSDIDKIAINLEKVNVREVVSTAVSTSPLAGAAIVGQCPDVVADPSRVRQILRNLLTNADRYGGDDVEVRLSNSEGFGRITIADDGPAITPDRQQAIFDPYVSAHEGGQQLGSIGLGLFISRKLALLMGGELRYRHDGGHGLFELSLPCADHVMAANN